MQLNIGWGKERELIKRGEWMDGWMGRCRRQFAFAFWNAFPFLQQYFRHWVMGNGQIGIHWLGNVHSKNTKIGGSNILSFGYFLFHKINPNPFFPIRCFIHFSHAHSSIPNPLSPSYSSFSFTSSHWPYSFIHHKMDGHVPHSLSTFAPTSIFSTFISILLPSIFIFWKTSSSLLFSIGQSSLNNCWPNHQSFSL